MTSLASVTKHVHYESNTMRDAQIEYECPLCLSQIAAFEADLDDLALERDGIKHSRTCPNNVVTGNPSELPCLRCQRDELERQTSSIEQQLRERCAALERRIEGLEARLESYTDLIDSAYGCENCWVYIPKETK